jgi:hypothetical protein
MINRNYVIRRMFFFINLEVQILSPKNRRSKVKNTALKTRAKICDIFSKTLFQLWLCSLFYDNGNKFSLDYLYNPTDTFTL